MNSLYASMFSWILSSVVSELLSAFARSWLMAVLEPVGGQTVTVGKSRSAMGWVSIEVATGDSCQAE